MLDTSEVLFNGFRVTPVKSVHWGTKNVIYGLICPCGLGYVGYTKLALRKRVRRHRHSFYSAKTKLYKHLRDCCCDFSEVKVIVLEVLPSWADLHVHEHEWMIELDSVRLGLNGIDPWMSRFYFSVYMDLIGK